MHIDPQITQIRQIILYVSNAFFHKKYADLFNKTNPEKQLIALTRSSHMAIEKIVG